MRISLIPWEFIWLGCFIILVISTIVIAVKQIREKTFQIPQSWLFYIPLIGVLFIPLTLSLTNYRFDLLAPSRESSTYDHPVSDLRIRYFPNDTVQSVFDASLAAVQTLHTYGIRWTITNYYVEDGVLAEIDATVPVIFLEDRVNIFIRPALGRPGVEVIVISLADERFADFGENGRHIRQFYQALEQQRSTSP